MDAYSGECELAARGSECEKMAKQGLPCPEFTRCRHANLPPEIRRLVRRDGRARIEAYRAYYRENCVSDAEMRRLIGSRSDWRKDRKFERARYRVGTVVQGTLWPAIYLVVGHGFTGRYIHERGCYGCRITDRIWKRWQWIGPDSALRRVNKSE
jgi:hypothetical protein